MFRFQGKRESVALTAALLGFVFVSTSVRAAPVCRTIAEGTIRDSSGNLLTTEPNAWGYHYEEHLYLGGYCGSVFDAPSCEPYRDVDLAMVWNDAWLSNTDCDGDGLLDRHHGFPTYRGSGAELVNAMHGRYVEGGQQCDWYQLQRFVAVPLDAQRQGGNWVSAEGVVLGQAIWTDFYVAESQVHYACLTDEPLSP